MQSETLPLEYKAILEWVKRGASVLDLGCGDGELLALLVREKSVKAQGIEIDEQAIYFMRTSIMVYPTIQISLSIM
jgi:cyclopropane fatty-acyl-phospholipid synthase-like methyltransferase